MSDLGVTITRERIMPPTDSMPIMPYPAFYVGRFASVAAEIEARDAETQITAKKAASNQVEASVKETTRVQSIEGSQPSDLSKTTSQPNDGAFNNQGRLNLLA